MPRECCECIHIDGECYSRAQLFPRATLIKVPVSAIFFEWGQFQLDVEKAIRKQDKNQLKKIVCYVRTYVAWDADISLLRKHSIPPKMECCACIANAWLIPWRSCKLNTEVSIAKHEYEDIKNCSVLNSLNTSSIPVSQQWTLSVPNHDSALGVCIAEQQ